MPTASNTSPISNLACIQRLPLLREQSGELWIPEAVEAELRRMLIDERDGRMLARQLGLRVTGVLGILLLGKKAGRVKALKPEIEALRAKAHFFIAPDLEAAVLAEAGE